MGTLWKDQSLTAGQGVITESHVVWKVKRGVSNKPSVLLVGELLYIISDAELPAALKRRRERLCGRNESEGNFRRRRLTQTARSGSSVRMARLVSSPLGTFQLLAENQLGDGFMASPAILGRALDLRREPICIGSRRAKRRRLRVGNL